MCENILKMFVVGTGCHRLSYMGCVYVCMYVGASTIGPYSENALFSCQDSFQRPQDD